MYAYGEGTVISFLWSFGRALYTTLTHHRVFFSPNVVRSFVNKGIDYCALFACVSHYRTQLICEQYTFIVEPRFCPRAPFRLGNKSKLPVFERQ